MYSECAMHYVGEVCSNLNLQNLALQQNKSLPNTSKLFLTCLFKEIQSKGYECL